MRYFRFVDTQDWDGLATLFCADGVLDTRGAAGRETPAENDPHVSRGKEAIVKYIRESLQFACSVHHGHGHEVAIASPQEAQSVIAMEDVVD
jgi:hypothetical protein